MADSIRKRIRAEVNARMSTGDAGERVQHRRRTLPVCGRAPKLGPDDPDCAIAIVSHDESPVLLTWQSIGGDWPIEIIGIANASPNRSEPWLLAEDVLADIRCAMELEDRTFGGALVSPQDMEVGAARTFERESAAEAIAVSQTYTFRTQRVWGHPEARR
jgi:hypothetical protein